MAVRRFLFLFVFFLLLHITVIVVIDPTATQAAEAATRNYSFSYVFPSDTDMYVGLSGSMGGRYQGCAVSSWSFSLITGLPPSSSKPSSTIAMGILIPSILGGALAAIIVLGAVAYYYRRKIYKLRFCWRARLARPADYRNTAESEDDLMGMNIPHGTLVPAALPRFTFKQLHKATQGFHERAKLGRGGFSTVYKGVLRMPPNISAKLAAGRPMDTSGSAPQSVTELVAVKRLNKEGLRKIDEFFAEIKMIHVLQHPRLVELKGWCYERGEAMLVYEIMSNGSLADQLFRGKKGANNLSSEVRVGILKGVAEALVHVHAAGAVHRDVKAANVLLSADMEVKLGDFGLLRLLKNKEQITVTTTAAGTPGYIAPELLFTRKPTTKVDVYAYGVLALEVACGRRVIHINRFSDDLDEHPDDPEQQMLVDRVWSKHESGMLLSVLDSTMWPAPAGSDGIGGSVDSTTESMWTCILHLALCCCHPLPDARPRMQDVLDALQHEKIMPLDPSRPSFPLPSSSNATSDLKTTSSVSTAYNGGDSRDLSAR